MDNLKQKLIFLWISQKMVIILILVLLSLIFLSSLTLASISAKKSIQKKLSTPTPLPQTAVKNNGLEGQLFKVFFQNYENESTLPKMPDSIKEYTFKSNFSKQEISDFAAKLGLENIQENSTNYTVASNTEDSNKIGILSFNKLTGSFKFISYGQVGLADKQVKDPKAIAFKYLQYLSPDLADDSLACSTTYNTVEDKDTTFVECHRDWNKIGLPIYSFLGLLNVDENIPFSSLKLGTVDAKTPADLSIVNVSTGKNADGKMRPSDFNTATLAIAKDGSIRSIESNLRWINNGDLIPVDQLLQPKEALKLFGEHKSTAALTVPSGSGAVDLNKVYSDNTATGQDATITDYVLSYLENPVSVGQESFVPFYTIRGFSTLDTGYRVMFVETIPAIKTAQ